MKILTALIVAVVSGGFLVTLIVDYIRERRLK